MRSPNRVLGAVVGAGYVVLGFVEATPVHTIAHVLIGAALLLAAVSSVGAAKSVNSVVGTVCLVLGLVGLFLVGSPANAVALTLTDNVLHFGTAVVLLAAGLGADMGHRVMLRIT